MIFLDSNEIEARIEAIRKGALETYEYVAKQAALNKKMRTASNRLCVNEETGEVLGRCNNCNVSL